MQINKIKALENLIGNTPLIQITYKYKGQTKQSFFKLEYFNLTGSIKDRIAINIIKNAYITGELKLGQRIVEATSGNTGISISAIAAFLGNPVTIIMPENMTDERKKIIASFGADLKLVTKDAGVLECKNLSQKIASKEKSFSTSQFENKYNEFAHYNSTSMEILESLSKINITPDAFISGVGTGGTLMGVAKKFKKFNKNAKIIALEPESSPVLKLGKKIGAHKLQGMNGDFIPSLLNKKIVDAIIDINDDAAICMANKLAKELGLGVGITGGANFLGVCLSSEGLPKNACLVSVFPDDNKKYLSTILKADKKNKQSSICELIELIDYKITK
jgi:cysteine synthase